jgi:hypothetical protein
VVGRPRPSCEAGPRRKHLQLAAHPRRSAGATGDPSGLRLFRWPRSKSARRPQKTHSQRLTPEMGFLRSCRALPAQESVGADLPQAFDADTCLHLRDETKSEHGRLPGSHLVVTSTENLTVLRGRIILSLDHRGPHKCWAVSLCGKTRLDACIYFLTTYQSFWMSCARRCVVIDRKPARWGDTHAFSLRPTSPPDLLPLRQGHSACRACAI